MDSYEYLAIAIVTQAAEDYRKEIKKHGQAPTIEDFFLSEYGDALSFGKGQFILDELKRESVEGRKGKTRPYLRYGMVPRQI